MRKAFISPLKYVQGENELENLGFFVREFGESALLIAHKDDVARVKSRLDVTEQRFDIHFITSDFVGECSRQEVARLQKIFYESGCSCTIGLGGGKAIDTAKCVAQGNALLIVPTIAATDAPTSHSAVLYTNDGLFDDYAYFRQNPNVVLIDTTIIAQAPVRFLVSGMGDALSTWFEARASQTSRANVNAGLPCGARTMSCSPATSTNAALAMARLCYETLLRDGAQAKTACECKKVTPALENIIEANILLSGLGFESGGLAAAHAIHDGLTILEGTHHFYHGEKVAFGTITQLVMENAPKNEIEEVLGFCTAVGLPICLGDIGLQDVSDEEILAVARKACIPEESVHAMPFPVSVETVSAAIKVADKLGRAFKLKQGSACS